jgi:transcription termination factor Rho
MNGGEGQRPPNAPEAAQAGGDAPEPGNARYPQAGANGANGQHPGQGGQGGGQGQGGQGQDAQGAGGRRRFRRQRRGGRGRRGKGGGGGQPGQGQQGQPGYQPPLDAQGRIVDVENDQDDGADDEGPEQAGQGGQPTPEAGVAPLPAAAAPVDGNQALPPPPVQAEGAPPQAAPAPGPQLIQPGQQPQQQGPRQQNQPRHQQNPRHQQQQRQEPTVPCEGVLDVDHRGNGKLRTAKWNYLPQPDDVEVPRHLIDRDRLRPGVLLTGQAVRRNGRLQLTKTDTVEGLSPADAAKRTAFQNLTVIDPDDRLVMETTAKEMITRVIDIVAPIGLGQRMLIVSPPKAGKTIMLQKICLAITTNRPDVIQMVLLVDERPEEVTDFRRTVKAEVFASSADRPTEEHLHVAEMVLERAKRLVEAGKDVVILLDSITRLSRAYNKEVESSGRTLSGGVDSRALERPKRLFGAARNAEEGGSLTIIGTALIDTGSRMDEVIFEEFKGTGNSEINLDRQLAEKRVFPAINIQTSGTRKEEKLFSQHEYEKVKKLRGALYALKPIEAMERLLKSLAEYRSNAEFLEAI